MRVLVTNDDGVCAPGIAALATALAEAGHVPIVAAPAGDMSGASASIMRVHSDAHIEVARVDLGTGADVEAWCVDATPALAVLSGVLGAFGDPPDIVLSGINAGLNTGLSILHSGTVGAALTAQRLGLSAMAISLAPGDPWRWGTAADVAIEQLEWLADAPPRTVLNLNVPDRPARQVAVRWAPLDPYGTVRASLADGQSGRMQLEMRSTGDEPPPGSDAALVAAGYVTITAIGGVHERGVPTEVERRPQPELEPSLEPMPAPSRAAQVGEAQPVRPATR
jgi:5'-nucleotidase